MHTGYPRGVFSCPAPAPAENPSRVYGWRDTRGYLYGSHAQYDILINTFKKIKNIFKKIKDFAGLGIPAHPCYTLWFVEASHLNAWLVPEIAKNNKNQRKIQKKIEITYIGEELGMPAHLSYTIRVPWGSKMHPNAWLAPEIAKNNEKSR